MNINKEHLNWLEFVFENKDRFEKLEDFYKAYDDYSFDYYLKNQNHNLSKDKQKFFKIFYKQFPLTSTILTCNNRLKKIIIKKLDDLFILHDKFETSLREYTILIASHHYDSERNSDVFENLFKYKNEFVDFEQIVYRLVYDSFSITNLKSDYNFESKFKTLYKYKNLLSDDTIKLISNNKKDSFMSQMYSTMIVPNRMIPFFENFDLDVDFDYSKFNDSYVFINSTIERFEKELLSIMKNDKKFTKLINHTVFLGFAVKHFNKLIDNWLRTLHNNLDKDNTLVTSHSIYQQKLAENISIFLNKVSPPYLKNLLIDRINRDVIQFMINNTEVPSELMMKLSKHIEIFEI